MKTKTNRFLSIFMILTILASLLTSLTMTVSAENYPGGTLLYESFTGLVSNDDDATITSPTYQPGENTIVQTKNKNKKVDSGVGLGDYAQQSRSSSNFLATIPASYLKTADETEVGKQGPNAKLTLEFDFKVEGEIPEEANTLTAILLGNSSLEGNNKAGRQNSAVAIYLTSPNVVNVYSKAGTATSYYLPEGVTFDKWHRYQLTVDLTDAESVGSSKYTLTIDGKNVVDADGKEMTSFSNKNMTATEISKLRIDTTKGYDADLDNVSIYKTTETYDSLSTGELMTKLHEVNAKMEGYRAEAEGTEALGNLESAVTAAGTMVTTAFGTYNENGAVVNAAKTQTEVDTALANLTAAEDALKTYLAGVTYPGGVLVYESFTGIVDSTVNDAIKAPTNQPKDTEATTSRKRAGNDSGAGLGDYARQHKDNSTTNFSATIPTAYFAEHTNTALVAAQGPDAKLTLEFDFKFDGDVKTTENILTAVSIGNPDIGVSTTGRGNAAVAVYLAAPNEVRFYKDTASTDYDVYYLPEGISYDQWHRYQLAVDLTDGESKGASTYTFTVDGKNVVDAEGAKQTSFTKKLSVTEISKVRIDTTKSGYYTRLDNVSVYKTTETYKSLSTASLMTKLHEVNAKMEAYQAAEGTEAWTTFNKAVTAAGEMVTTAFGTYDENGTAVNPVKSQEDVDAVLLELENAETALKNVLSPYYVSGLITDETTGELTGVTVQEIKEAADVNAKMIIATYDENGMVAAQIQAVTAGENTLTSSMDITGKTVKVFIWDMSESTLLDYLADVYTFENVVTE